MVINVISKVENVNSSEMTGLFAYNSDVIPSVGDYLTFGEYKTFKVNERVFMIKDNMRTSSVELYGIVL